MLHLIWDMDGTLVDSGPEILATIQKALAAVRLSLEDACQPLRIGPPLPVMLRASFEEKVLSDNQIQEVISAFRSIYDTSDFEDTKPFDGIEEIIYNRGFEHHIITNKPDYATRRIIEKKGWTNCIADVLSPDTLTTGTGRPMNKRELFQYFKAKNPDLRAVGVGDMAGDAICAKTVNYPAIGVLWGTGSKDELIQCGCDAIVASTVELRNTLERYNEH